MARLSKEYDERIITPIGELKLNDHQPNLWLVTGLDKMKPLNPAAIFSKLQMSENSNEIIELADELVHEAYRLAAQSSQLLKKLKKTRGNNKWLETRRVVNGSESLLCVRIPREKDKRLG